jgi:SET domain-containing protein
MDILEIYLEKLDLDNKKVYKIGPSKIHGNGVIAKKHFKPGEYINICVSKIRKKFPQFDITKFGSHLNHSYKANAEIKKEPPYYNTYARNKIQPDEEVTVNYS